MIFDENGLRCSATERLDTHGARACKDIEKARFFHGGPKNVEQSLAQTVAGWTEGVSFEALEQAAAVGSSDDAHINHLARGGSVAAIPREGGAINAAEQGCPGLPPGRKLHVERSREVRGHARGWQSESPNYRLGACQKIL